MHRNRHLILIALFALANCRLTATSANTPLLPHFSTAAAARAWAEEQERSGNYALASDGYAKEAAMRRALGDEQAAEVEERRAGRLATDIKLSIPVEDAAPQVNLAKLEPAQGCLIGVRDEEGQNAESFVNRLGRPISITYDYLAYGDPFPMNWARDQARAHRAIQIAWEPSDIGAVMDDQYLEDFAVDAGRCGTGVFIRFGGEMNGNWTPWGRDAAEYIKAFRTVHDVMDRFAQNVAMVWAPNQVPLANIDRFYPGDSYVDWVGVSAYTVRFYDDNLSQPASQDSPATMIEPFYRKYSSRKPICLVECGVSRRSKVENADADGFAGARITDLMNAIRVRFPRLKMICFFDRNNLTGAVPNRRLNDYSLPEGSKALAALVQAAGDPYFIRNFSDADSAPFTYVPVAAAFPPGYSGPVLASIITYDMHPTLTLKQGGKVQTIYRPYLGHIAKEAGPTTFTVLDSHGKFAGALTVASP
jgi:hypothetical protein